VTPVGVECWKRRAAALRAGATRQHQGDEGGAKQAEDPDALRKLERRMPTREGSA